MTTRGGAACKVCAIIALVVFVLVVGVSAFLLLYTPKSTKVSEKLASDSVTAIFYEEGKTEYSTNINKVLSFINENFSTKYEIKEVVEFYTEGLSQEDENYVEGYVFYMDGIGSSYKLFKEYVQYIRNTESKDASQLNLHFSPRGKILFVGNTNAEIEFRRIIF